ncbi:MAG: 2,3-cyclic-nucleotide 2-phosphodiesterase, partial [Bacillus sp. (in: firmicutes)]|nr:2,3-cyclic-nucleotide 2-phosphodiesterase [Bacillus sp. (in: firmicutes)]
KKGGYFVDNNNNLVMFHVPDTAIFCIKEGNKIIVSPIKGYEEDKMRLYILGTCMGILLMQRKVLTLHGSAIAIDGKVYAFIGESGAGKSTLASVFIRKGYQFLSDDVIAVSLSKEGIPYVFPSYPQQKLWQESLQEFGMKTTEYRPLFERETKFAVPVKSSFLDEALPLAGVFELVITENSNISLNRIESLARFSTLFNHTFRQTLIPRLDLIEWHFRESANILKRIHLYQLQRPNVRFTADELVTNILHLIEKEG